MSNEKIKEIKEKVDHIRENNLFSNDALLVEAQYEALMSEGSDELYSGDGHQQARAKKHVVDTINAKDADFIKSQRMFMNKVMEAASNTSVQHISTFRKLLPEVLARSANMALAIDNIAHVIDMPTNSMVVPFHRRVIGDSSSTTEALYDQLDSSFGGAGSHANTMDPYVDAGDTDTTPNDGIDDAFAYGNGNTRVASENLTFSTMDKVANRIDQVTITAGSRNSAMSVSTESIQDAQNEYGVNLIREGLLTMQAELYRSISAEMYARLAIVAKKETAAFNFGSVGATDADNFYLKNAFLLQQIEIMRAKIQTEVREPGIQFKIIATPRVVARLRMVDRLHAPTLTSSQIERNFDNTAFYRGKVGDYEIYEAADYANNNDFIMLVAKGSTAATSPMIYGNYVPFFLMNTLSPDTSHNVFFGKIRSGVVGNPLGNENESADLTIAQAGQCRYARFLRVTGLV